MAQMMTRENFSLLYHLTAIDAQTLRVETSCRKFFDLYFETKLVNFVLKNYM